jgi:hypothetical protein
MDLVVILLDLDDETWDVTPAMPRWIAELACYGFGTYAEPWNGRRVTRALLIPREEKVH